MEEWRILLYPLGFLSSLAFGSRFIVQWLQSERRHQSFVPISFWYLSIMGNGLLALHGFIQVQYPVCMIQVFNSVIAWRNLNLMGPLDKRISFSTVLKLLWLSFLVISLAFASQDYFEMRNGHWFRSPVNPWQTQAQPEASLLWHGLGAVASLLFSSRFWLQWWLAEKSHTSELPISFWWLSLIGATLSILYFWRIQDLVNLIGPLIGIIPYVRNLMLIQKAKAFKT